MDVTMRKFEFTKDGMMISKNGEFIHINDILLKLSEEKQSFENMLEINTDSDVEDSEWNRKHIFSLKEKISLLEKIRNDILK